MWCLKIKYSTVYTCKEVVGIGKNLKHILKQVILKRKLRHTLGRGFRSGK